MSEKEKLREIILLTSLGKLYSEQSTFLTKELKHKPKQKFNNAVIAVDAFVKEIESILPAESLVAIQDVVDEFHLTFQELRKYFFCMLK